MKVKDLKSMKKKTLLLISFIFISFFLFSQIKLDVEGEAWIHSNLRVGNDSDDNIFIGNDAGKNTIAGDFDNGKRNLFLGNLSGFKNTNGKFNTYLGNLSGRENETGRNNTFIGYSAGYNSISYNNTFIGTESGFNNDGNSNIFLGYRAGSNAGGSSKLYIENSDSDSPLIYGEFDNDKIQINGSLHITEFMNLVPGNAPTSPEKGTMYYDSSDDKVKVWTGSWENLFFNNPSQSETSFNSTPCASDCTNALNKSVKKQELLVQENNVLRERLESVESDLQEMKKMIIQIAQNEGVTTNSFIVEKQSELEQNIPNPFNGTTKINYYIPPTSQKANLKIFSISGQLVENINIKTFGRGEIEVSLENLKNGLYHYSLEVDGQIIDTKKMTSIK